MDFSREPRSFVARLSRPDRAALAGEACIEPNSKLGPDAYFWKVTPFTAAR